MTYDPCSLVGKNAIVTGASRSIGAAIARELSRRGANVVITYASESSEADAIALVEELTGPGKRAIKVQCNLAMPDGPLHLVEQAIVEFPEGIDILVNNAGVAYFANADAVTVDDYHKTFDVNTLAPLILIQSLLPHLRRPGRIINISSISSRSAHPKTLTLSASKAALEGFTRVWAAELGKDGTTVNCINPGSIDGDNIRTNLPAKAIEHIESSTPVQNRLGTAEDVALAVGFLACEESRWVSGQCISVSGGREMY